jgi:hypothetical protein
MVRYLIKRKVDPEQGQHHNNDDGFNSATQELVRVWNESTEVLLMTLLLALLSFWLKSGLLAGILSVSPKGVRQHGHSDV